VKAGLAHRGIAYRGIAYRGIAYRGIACIVPRDGRKHDVLRSAPPSHPKERRRAQNEREAVPYRRMLRAH
jgi:hypothetical protein